MFAVGFSSDKGNPPTNSATTGLTNRRMLPLDVVVPASPGGLVIISVTLWLPRYVSADMAYLRRAAFIYLSSLAQATRYATTKSAVFFHSILVALEIWNQAGGRKEKQLSFRSDFEVPGLNLA